MVAGGPARELSERRGPAAASMGREDPAPGAERGGAGRALTALGREREREPMGWTRPRAPGLRTGTLGSPEDGALDGGGPDPARLSAADGGLGPAPQPGAHVRAWLSPSSLRAPAGSVPSPQPSA